MSNLSPFGGGKNPPWVRNAGQGIQNIQQQMLGQAMGGMGGQPMVQYQQQTQQVYQQGLGLQQPNLTMASMAQLGSNLPSGIAGQLYPQVATVSYPTPRTLNANAFQQTVGGVQQQVQQNVQSSSTKQRVFTGTVTKVHDNFGFVDEDVFFQTNACVKGSNPIIGDRVLVEASFNPSMPFKWNATRIQVLPMTGNSNSSSNSVSTPAPQNPQQNRQPQSSRPSGTYNAVPPPNDNTNSSRFSSNNSTSTTSNRNKPARVRERSRERRNDDEEVERKRRREERIREREKKEERSPSRTRRSKSPRPRRRTRVVPRYMVQIPKIALDLPEADVLEIRRRYQNMYIPSDFFSTNFRWVDAFPPHMPFTLNKPCSFHVMHKDVDGVVENSAVLEPPDADYLFSAKVMLMSMPAMEEIYKRCCGVTEDRDPDRDYVHPTRLINFLVGLRGKNETMAIGGPWSPSLDGPNPESDPSVLIRTAVRTCKALTGIDLSHCTQWYRFLELYYRRAETTHKSGRVVASRVETVILFLPDVWSCVSTKLEWDTLHLSYKRQLDRKLMGAGGDGEMEVAGENDDAAVADQKDDTTPEKKDPTHYSELDPKSMNVNDLRQELAARNLSSKGLKSQLSARLTKAIKSEQAKEEGRQDEAEDNEEEIPPPPKEETKEEKKSKEHDEDKKKNSERERALLEKRYTLPESPHIIVHPSRIAKSGKFDCTVMSLSVLLDYRPEDTKEHSFEVSLFAELFNEMLMRDFGFRIYRSLCSLPEKSKEKEEDPKKPKKEEKPREDKNPEDKKRKDEDDKKSKNSKKDERKRETSKDKNKDEKEKEKTTKSDEKDREEDEDEYEDETDDDDSVKDGKREKEKDGKKKKPKLYTYDPYLLLSFVYFDQTHCGYIFDKDIEELIYTLGLNLSRAQVRKLVQKVVTRDSLHYRKLTDRSKEDEDKDKEKSKEEKEAADEGHEEVEDEEELKSLALGNKKLLPVFVSGQVPSKRARGENQGEGEESVPEGFVMFKGSLLDVEKLVSQLKRSEKARVDTEARMGEIQHELASVSEKAHRQGTVIRDLGDDLKGYKDKLRSVEEKLKKTSSECYTYLSAIKNVYHTTSKVMQSDSKKVEIVEIQDEKSSSEINGSQSESKSKSDTRWSDSRSSVKKELEDKDKKHESKSSVKKEPMDVDKEKK
ncbi:cell division cycle and apoptosis regulator protein 1 isoform X2 [Diachasma alloeum]|uniref:cell division cycle and apoptosis regulator protein 1 isoform X2 n=1 Tax=Diachasma alloeum TaxID=454923 RepID=UPI000738244C|nr:cell division cycle and apoptosis regulator protein 1 isoform X2 [Diachasma alloeum]